MKDWIMLGAVLLVIVAIGILPYIKNQFENWENDMDKWQNEN